MRILKPVYSCFLPRVVGGESLVVAFYQSLDDIGILALKLLLLGGQHLVRIGGFRHRCGGLGQQPGLRESCLDARRQHERMLRGGAENFRLDFTRPDAQIHRLVGGRAYLPQ